MQRHKLDFRNKNFLEQLAMFDKLITSLDATPSEKREDEYLEALRIVTASARASNSRIASLRAELKSEISNRKALFDSGRKSALRAGLGAALKTQQPSEVIAIGLDLPASTKTPVGLPAMPFNLRADPTDGEGEAMLRWKRTVRRCSFEIQWSINPSDANGWHHHEICFPEKCLVQGLVSGTKYWFRVRAGNAHGQSAWSQVASVRVK